MKMTMTSVVAEERGEEPRDTVDQQAVNHVFAICGATPGLEEVLKQQGFTKMEDFSCHTPFG